MEKVLENQVSRFRNWEERARERESESGNRESGHGMQMLWTALSSLFAPLTRLIFARCARPPHPADGRFYRGPETVHRRTYTAADTLRGSRRRGGEGGGGVYVLGKRFSPMTTRRSIIDQRVTSPTTTPELSHSLPFLFHHDHLEAFRSTCQLNSVGHSSEPRKANVRRSRNFSRENRYDKSIEEIKKIKFGWKAYFFVKIIILKIIRASYCSSIEGGGGEGGRKKREKRTLLTPRLVRRSSTVCPDTPRRSCRPGCRRRCET